MPPRNKAATPAPLSLLWRTPIAEWTAAGLGLLLTLAVVGYSLWEALAAPEGPPELSARLVETSRVGSGYVAEIEVRNVGYATAADVEVSAALARGGDIEAHTLTFAYVPARGVARGGVVFRNDPASGALRLSADAYVAP